MQNEWAGAQAFSSFDTYLAPFVKVDNLTYPEVKKCIESFIYGVNTPSRWNPGAVFQYHPGLDQCPRRRSSCVVGGKEMDFLYKDCKKEMDMVNKAFIEIMIEAMPTEEASSILSLPILLPRILTGPTQKTTDSSLK